jgi:1-acyl-sn-glycerol-3-phosphate acyltransferase
VSLSERFVVGFFRLLTSLICRIDDTELTKVPAQGPVIVYTNHVNMVEIPIIYTCLQPRKLRGMLLADRWKIPLINWALNVAGAIPLHRGKADVHAIRMGLKALAEGKFLIISPEGTRSHDGRLQAAQPGVVLLALHSAATLVPVGYYGAECYMDNLKKLQRTDFHLRVGQPFRLNARGKRVSHQVRKQMLDELMYRLAVVLPAQYRGVYADLSCASTQYIELS